MPIPELDTIELQAGQARLQAERRAPPRVSRRASERGRIFAISGKSGGRDIQLCIECGKAKSWRSVAGMETREEDAAFDLTRSCARS